MGVKTRVDLKAGSILACAASSVAPGPASVVGIVATEGRNSNRDEGAGGGGARAQVQMASQGRVRVMFCHIQAPAAVRLEGMGACLFGVGTLSLDGNAASKSFECGLGLLFPAFPPMCLFVADLLRTMELHVFRPVRQPSRRSRYESFSFPDSDARP
jgi:hypothetical protein